MATRSGKHRLPKTKTPEEWQRLFGEINCRYDTQARNHALLYLCYMCGLRIGEALALHPEDVDFIRMRLRVRDGKTGERIVPLPDDEQLRHTIDRWMGIRQVWDPPSPLLFVTKPGKPLHPNAVRDSVRLYGDRAGLGHVTPHMLRHSCATELLAAGASAIGVQRVLGHRSLATTLVTYAHAADSHAAEAMLRR